jgi:3-methyladenine DNA glycosylase Mpg
MRRRRRPDGTVIADSSLCDGPGKLTQALAITRALDGTLMTEAEVVVEWGPTRTAKQFETTRRVGITRAADRLLRFVVC